MLEVGSLLVDHLGQELVLQTVPCHCKIDEGGLGLDLGFVVRIGQLGVQDESEAWMEETLFVPHLYTAVREQREKLKPMMAKNYEERMAILRMLTKRSSVSLLCYLPFLIVCRPSRGSRTGSMVSSRFSMRTVSPATTACSITST